MVAAARTTPLADLGAAGRAVQQILIQPLNEAGWRAAVVADELRRGEDAGQRVAGVPPALNTFSQPDRPAESTLRFRYCW